MTEVLGSWVLRQIQGNPPTTFRESTRKGQLCGTVTAEAIPFDAEGKRKLQFRVEFFNIMNTPQFQIPNRTFNTPQFGTITETVADNRDIQLALRFLW